ncbi:MAG: FAD-dependent oxidoreductase [Pseudomonadota bacterium]
MKPIGRVWTASPPTIRPTPLDGSVSADVLVIGAGFAGLAAALDLVEGGRSVVVLDAGEIGDSASAASAGQVAPFMYGARRTPDLVVQALGADRGGRLNRRVAASGRWLFDRIAALGIDAEAREGFIGVHRTEASLAAGAAFVAQWAAYGGRPERLGRDDLRGLVGSDRYVGGFRWIDGGIVNPARLVDGMASAAARLGGAIYSRSRVTALRQIGGHWEASTDRGSVVARQVIVATGSAGLPAWPALARTVYAAPVAIAATAPLPDRAAGLLPQGGPVADMDDKAVFSPAVTADGRLVVSFLMNGLNTDIRTAPHPARRRLARAFPDWTVPPFESLSWGQVALTPDGLPRLIQGEDGLIAVTGCNGAGLTLGILAGREAARFALGTPEEALVLPLSPATPLPFARTMPVLLRNLLVPIANHIGA